MSETLGVIAYEKAASPFLKGDQLQPAQAEYSEQTARKIDEEISSILQRSYEGARALLKERMDLLDRVAARLQEQEVISGQEFAQIMEESTKGHLEGRKAG